MKKQITISGQEVHGVGYRPFLLAEARKLGIKRFEAENRIEHEGQWVDICIDADEDLIEKFNDRILEKRLPNAKVSNIQTKKEVPERDIMLIGDYAEVLSAEQQSKMVQAGLGMLSKQVETINEIKVVGTKVDTVGTSVNNLTNTTQENFNHLDTKYGSLAQEMHTISNGMSKLLAELVKERNESKKSTEKLVNAMMTLVEKVGK